MLRLPYSERETPLVSMEDVTIQVVAKHFVLRINGAKSGMHFQAEDARGAKTERWETAEAHGLLSCIRLEWRGKSWGWGVT